MQYTKVGFHWLFKGCGSHQVQSILIGNRSAIRSFSYYQRLCDILKKRKVLQ
jgi:hypothetical protein